MRTVLERAGFREGVGVLTGVAASVLAHRRVAQDGAMRRKSSLGALAEVLAANTLILA